MSVLPVAFGIVLRCNPTTEHARHLQSFLKKRDHLARALLSSGVSLVVHSAAIEAHLNLIQELEFPLFALLFRFLLPFISVSRHLISRYDDYLVSIVLFADVVLIDRDSHILH